MYDRALLLLGAKRNELLELWEVQQYGADSFGDADYVALYGMSPAGWYAKGVRVLGRTAVECTRDELGDAIGRDVATVAATAPPSGPALVVDLFAGSGNTLYWLLRHLPGARGLGFELDPDVFRLTRQNVAALALPIEILNADYRSGLAASAPTAGELVVAFIAPPWGSALDRSAGLDLRRTTPPIAEVVDALAVRLVGHPLLSAVQVYEAVEPASLADLERRFDWSALRVYDLNEPGENHGILIGTRGWSPGPLTQAGAPPSP
jgi:hypothetical protein